MVTLHAYVLRELLKTFGLALLALTVLFTMGGGLYNVMRYEGVTTADVFRFLPLMIPIVTTLTMPLAALFAVTMVYGRLAADNELTACRASGVNIHRLFLGAVLLSLFVSIFALFFGNYVIPDFMRRLDRFARSNLRDMAAERIKLKGYVRFPDRGGQKVFLTARGLLEFSPEQLAERGYNPALDHLMLDQPVCLQIGPNDEVLRYTTAQRGMAEFDTRTTPLRVTLIAFDGWEYSSDGRGVRIGQQAIGPLDVPLPMPLKPSMVDLNELLMWQREPWQSAELGEKVREFQAKFTLARVYDATITRLNAGEAVVLSDAQQRDYVIRAATTALSPKGRPVLTDASVTIGPPNDPRPTRYEAPRASLAAYPQPDGRYIVDLKLDRSAEREVREFNPRSADYETPRLLNDVNVDGALVPPALLELGAAATPPNVFDPAVELPLAQELADERIRLQRDGAKLQRKVTSVINFRLGTAVSTLATVLMGAILGVMFRGGQALAAFGLAFVPFGSFAILMAMGGQLGQNEGTEVAGAAVIWFGILGLGLVDLVLLRLGVRR